MRPISLAGLVALSLAWGASFMFIKVMLEEMGPIAVGWVRLGGGATFIVATTLASGRRVPLRPGHWVRVAPVGLLASAAPFVLIPWGEQRIDSALAAVLNSATPLFAAGFAHLLIPAERLTATRVAGLALGFAGVCVVIGPAVIDVGAADTRAQLAVVLASCGYGAGAVYVRRQLLGMDPAVLAGTQSAVAFALLTPLVLAAGEVPDPRALSAGTWLAAGGLTVISSGLALLLYYWLLSHLHAAQASLVTYLVPVSAIAWGALVLDERPGLAVAPGLALIACGIMLVNRTGARPPGALPRSAARL